MIELLEAWCFKGTEEFIFLFLCYYWFILLFCRLLWNEFGELVLMMERDCGCSMDTLYELYESWLCEWFGVELSREREDGEIKNIYDAG
jgi:hypothetical protein